MPVVIGRAEYDFWVPRSAYINALDFASPQDLAAFLTKLSTDESAYNQYFEWKKFLDFDKTPPYQGYLCQGYYQFTFTYFFTTCLLLLLTFLLLFYYLPSFLLLTSLLLPGLLTGLLLPGLLTRPECGGGDRCCGKEEARERLQDV